jgi:Zn-dependent protease
MFTSLKLGKCFGIDLYVHSSFWLLPLFIAFSVMNQGAIVIALSVLMVLAVFGCVLLHELGHALAARGYGIATRHITLYPFGGVAALERMPSQPGREVAIALAGPAVNLVIAGALALGLWAGSNLIPNLHNNNDAFGFLETLMTANLVLFGFNLIPAFPMDGGRVLRALLATRMSRVRATTIAAGVGTVVAGIFVIAGVLLWEPMLLLLAAVVFFLGQAELAMTRVVERGRDLRDRVVDFFAPPEPEDAGEATATGPPSPGFSGLAWDATRHVWVEWKNGRPIGALPPAH